MTAEIGLGLLLNILFWTVAVLAAVGLGSFAVIRYFPGRKPKARREARAGRGVAPAAGARDEADEPERYRNAS